jgi:chlorophyllide a reductase subunit X
MSGFTQHELRRVETLRQEAAEPLAPVATGEPTRKTQVIAIYGKGGIGKSFTLAGGDHLTPDTRTTILE